MLVNGVYGDLLSNHASFFIALVAMVLGTQLSLLVLLATLLVVVIREGMTIRLRKNSKRIFSLYIL